MSRLIFLMGEKYHCICAAWLIYVFAYSKDPDEMSLKDSPSVPLVFLFAVVN